MPATPDNQQSPGIFTPAERSPVRAGNIDARIVGAPQDSASVNSVDTFWKTVAPPHSLFVFSTIGSAMDVTWEGNPLSALA